MATCALKIHETTTPDGRFSPVLLTVDAGAMAIADDDGSHALPAGALDAVMARFGAPFEPTETLLEVARLEIAHGKVLRHVRHRARFDVIAKDYLLYEVDGSEARGALATTVSGALAHLARALR